MGARRHDDRVRGFGFEIVAWDYFNQLVARQVGQIVEGLNAVFSQRHQHCRGDALQRGDFVRHFQFATFLGQLGIALDQVFARAFAKFLGEILVKSFDLGQFFRRHERHRLDRREPLGHQQMGDHIVDVEGFHEQIYGYAKLLDAALRLLRLGHDVDVPTGELGRQADVLSAPSDRQAQLVVGDHDLDPLGFLVEHHLGHLGRRQGVDDEGRGIGVPLDDVDLLALQLVDHRLHPAAPHSDTGANRIDARIVRQDGDLRARAGIARHRFDLDNAVVDLGNLLGEQPRHEFRPRARHEDLRSAQFAPHVVNVGAQPFAIAEILARQGFVAPHDGLGAAEIDDHIAVLDALDQTVDDLADAVFVFFELAVALGIADALDNDLLRGLRGDAAKIDRRQWFDEKIADT